MRSLINTAPQILKNNALIEFVNTFVIRFLVFFTKFLSLLTKLPNEHFFEILKSELSKVILVPIPIFNVDETELTIMLRMTKVLCMKRQMQVGGLTSTERGSFLTLVFCTS